MTLSPELVKYFNMKIEEQVPDITKKIDAFKAFINHCNMWDGHYTHMMCDGQWDKEILVLSLKGYTDKQISDKIECTPSYFKARRKILFDRFKNDYLDQIKQKKIKEENYQVWNKAIRENRVF